MPLIARYERELAAGRMQADEQQQTILIRLNTMGADLSNRRGWKAPSRSRFSQWFTPSSSGVKGVQGLYLWGGVGRGKTYLCDLFFEEVNIQDKTRLHFHRFMQRIHTDLRKLSGVDEPLDRIADDWAQRARLLLLDEIHVNDITDAMLLGGLLTALFHRGVTLVTTSNVPPEGLYKDGLQRARFLPAIAQIKNHTEVVSMGGDLDYRLRALQTEPIYRVSHFENGRADSDTQQAMQDHFDRLRGDAHLEDTVLSVNGRHLQAIAKSADVIWLEYDELCNSPRSTHDYIEIASEFRTVMISNLPVLDESRSDEARRLVNLVDEFYDRGVNMIVSAEAAPEQLYTGKRLSFEFVRAASRLTEMQTREYLSAPRHDAPSG